MKNNKSHKSEYPNTKTTVVPQHLLKKMKEKASNWQTQISDGDKRQHMHHYMTRFLLQTKTTKGQDDDQHTRNTSLHMII